jgi:hypothetical protein
MRSGNLLADKEQVVYTWVSLSVDIDMVLARWVVLIDLH